MTNTDRKTGKIKKILPRALFGLLGIACGFLAISYLDLMNSEGRPEGETFLFILLYLVCVYGAILLQIVIHEAGHLLFGRITGYGFSSFRVGNLIWIKEGQRIKLRRYSLAGLGGQCLCIPPEMKDGKCPYVLYNLGGSIMNLASALIFYGVAQMADNTGIMQLLLLLLAIVGAAFAVINGIPMRLGMVDNDGYNALSLGKNAEALRSFWIQLMVNGQMTSGVRLKDMPDDWFYLPSEDSMKNSMTAVMGVFFCNRLMDQMKLIEAEHTLDRLLQMDTGIVGLHRNLLKAERIYCELVGENRQDRLNSLLGKQQKKFMKAMRNFLFILRIEYAYALLAERDEAKANRIKINIERVAAKYPYPGEVAAERELIAHADSLRKICQVTTSYFPVTNMRD